MPNKGLVWYASPAAGLATHSPDVGIKNKQNEPYSLNAVLIDNGCMLSAETTVG